MVGPARKREAVVHVRRSLNVSERGACRATRQPRSTQRYQLNRLDKDKALLKEILRLSAKEKRAGCGICAAMVGRSITSGCTGFGRERDCACRLNRASGGSLEAPNTEPNG